ncbi:hypothetical protein MSG28_004931 [Choristoneura fumiferana]|uniref:Uncharacterized protein n=1 Tax=Choristoneura fumiferana TaxID=7141 RepID=A0ACC0JPF9_CHOFU|nr:hypothetical protein MSG28_004931 [Choristoneura fumiferana]
MQEPFWLGLIAVFVVLGIIGLVWCAKRHARGTAAVRRSASGGVLAATARRGRGGIARIALAAQETEQLNANKKERSREEANSPTTHKPCFCK